MPWIDKPTEPGYYYSILLYADAPVPLCVIPNDGQVESDDALVVACACGGRNTIESFGPTWLRIPPPSVLLAMEKFIAAERARRKQRNKEVKCVGGYIASDVMVERAHAQHIADAEWYALARAEAEAKEGKP